MELLARSPGLNDDEIAEELGIEPRQTVNRICRGLLVRGVLERSRGSTQKIINTLTDTSVVAPEIVATSSTTPARARVKGTGNKLTPIHFEKTLLIIPCSKGKLEGGDACNHGHRLTDRLPAELAAELVQARESVAQKSPIDESALMPAWRRYDGSLYRAAHEALGDLLAKGMHMIILSGGYGALLAQEPIGNYNARLKPSLWPNKLLARVLLAYARSQGISSVRAFASATSPYFRVLSAVRWEEAGVEDHFLISPEARRGGTLKSPASIGQAIAALCERNLDTGWKSSYGLELEVRGR